MPEKRYNTTMLVFMQKGPEAPSDKIFRTQHIVPFPPPKSGGGDLILRLVARLRDTDVFHRASTCGKL